MQSCPYYQRIFIQLRLQFSEDKPFSRFIHILSTFFTGCVPFRDRIGAITFYNLYIWLIKPSGAAIKMSFEDKISTMPVDALATQGTQELPRQFVRN